MLGNVAVARACLEYGVGLASGYPGTPSSEVVEALTYAASKLGYPYVEWSVNEKVAFEVAYGAAISGVPSVVSMKHIGLNVAADPFFSSAYTGVEAPLLVISADDPGMWSSQNGQDTASEVAEMLGDVRVANVYPLGRALLKTRLGAIISFDFDSVARALRGLPNPELNLGSRARVQGWGV
jgi:TPP-dependent indolepyruvate ferredoxin oxidoreductase alpha subunit